MKYRFLLFDLDNTLLDFDANEAQALPRVFAAHGVTLTPEIRAVYDAINHGLWQDYEAGKVAIETVLNTRFAKTMQHFGAEADGAAWERDYRRFLGDGHEPIPGAVELCKNLAAAHTYEMYVVTNGVAATQEKRMREAGIEDYFRVVFNSESIGAQKPSQAFFDYVFAHIDGFDKRSALLIGDSVTADIEGGRRAGLTTCWFNKKGISDCSEIPADYKINSLAELPGILESEEKPNA